jgi:hypothetical protein
MKRSLCTAVLAAGVLLVAGCSSNNAGTGSAASTAAASSSVAASSESMTSESMGSSSESSPSESSSSESASGGTSTASGSGASGSASVAPANLDEQTKTWFTTLCEGVAPIGELANLDTSGQDAATAQKTGVTALQQFATVLTDTSTKLKSTPPPTFEGGTEFANQVSSGLAESGPKLAAVATKFAAISPSDTAALKQAFEGLSGELSSAIAPLQQLSQLPPDVSAAAKEIPACKSLNG